MGLAFYRTPEDVAAEDTSAKLDRAAAQQRSAIRREPTESSSTGLTNVVRHRANMAAQGRRSHELELTDAEIEALEIQLSHLRQRRRRRNHRASTVLDERRSRAALLRDARRHLERDRTDSVTRSPSPVYLPQSTRESNLRFEVDGIPSPPSSAENGDMFESTPPLTRGFAPAHRGIDTPPPELDGYPPLRRVPHMSPGLLPREESTWDTLLTSLRSNDNAIHPLEAAAQEARMVHGSQSSTASFGEIGTSSEDTCDPPPGISFDDVRRIRERHRRNPGRVAPPERRESSLTTEHQRRHHELLLLDAIVDRYSSNADVPDEWLALVGLPSVSDRSRDES